MAPNDIDEVHAGLVAQVHLLAYRSQNLPRIEGTVREVSADRLEDRTTHQPYYLARVAVATEALPAGIVLSAGMPADVAIVTAERTMLDYLLRRSPTRCGAACGRAERPGKSPDRALAMAFGFVWLLRPARSAAPRRGPSGAVRAASPRGCRYQTLGNMQTG